MRKSVEFLILILCSLQIYLHPFRYWWHFINQGGNPPGLLEVGGIAEKLKHYL